MITIISKAGRTYSTVKDLKLKKLVRAKQKERNTITMLKENG